MVRWLLSLLMLVAPPLLAGPAPGPGGGGLIAAEDFESYAPGSIQGGSGGSGWGASWQGTGVQSVIDSSGARLSYRAGNGERVLGGVRALAFTGNDDLAAQRQLDSSRRDREVYVSMLIRFEGQPDDNDFLGFWFDTADFTAAPNIGLKANHGDGSSANDFFARTQANNHVSQVDLVPGQTYFLVGRLSKPNSGVPTRYDEFQLWVNPATLSVEPPPDAVSTGTSGIANFSRVGFRAVNLDAGDRVTVDRLRLGSRWEDVAAPDLAPVLEQAMDESAWTGAVGEVRDGASGFHGTAFGGVTTAADSPAIAGTPGTCRYGAFDGVNDHVEIPHAAALNGSAALTYAAWIRPRSWSGVRQVMAKSVHGGGSGRAQMGMFSESGVFKVRAEAVAGRYEVSAALPALDAWTHLAAVFEGARLVLYVNGQAAASTSFPATTLVQTTDPLAISKRVGSNQYFFAGDIDEVRVYGEGLTADEVASLVQEVRPCAVLPGNRASAFRVDHDGAGIFCLDEPVQVTALDAVGATLVGYDQAVVLSTSTGRGTWRLLSGAGTFADATPDDGQAAYRFVAGDGGVAQFALGYREGDAVVNVNVAQSDDATIRDVDDEGPLLFAPTGFTVTASALSNPPPSPIDDPLPAQVAAVAFPLHIAAYGVTEDDPQCGVIESYDAARSLSFATAHINPGSGPLLATVDGVPADGAGTQSVTFDRGQASVSVGYKDVGQIRISVQDASSFPQALQGASNPFVVRPAALVVSRVESGTGAPNPGATTPDGAAFVPAGEPFVVEVEARDADGDRTPSFGRESPPESVRVSSAALVMPVGGRNGSSGDVTGGDTFALTGIGGRLRSTSVLFDEVGSISLGASLLDGDYLGAGPVGGPLSGAVGRFRAAAFDVIGDAVTAACGAFTYLDQPQLGLRLRLQALNAAGDVTQNYDAGLLSGVVAGVSYAAESDDDGVDLGGRLAAVGGSWRNGEIVVDRADLSMARLAVPDGPFESLQLSVRVVDALDAVTLLGLDQNPLGSGDCGGAGNCSHRGLGAPTRMRYGRLAVLPALGPENEDLDVALRAQYFDGGGFVAHPADACTGYAAAAVALSDFDGNLNPGETAVIGPVGLALLAGGGSDPANPLRLSAPGFGNDGSVVVTVDAPTWLEFDWQGTGQADPGARAAFGRHRGHDRIIFWREQR
ncbi:MAG: LamG domain-containing protein [Pseudomonadales bacterium]